METQKRNPIFVHDSDVDDSVATDSTVSDDEGCVVDKILMELVKPDGEVWYLVAWQDRRLGASTWEVQSHLTDDVLQGWRRRKELETSGSKTPFDLEDFENDCMAMDEEQTDRRHRRSSKRRKLGLPVSTCGIDHNQSRSHNGDGDANPASLRGAAPVARMLPDQSKSNGSSKEKTASKGSSAPATKAPPQQNFRSIFLDDEDIETDDVAVKTSSATSTVNTARTASTSKKKAPAVQNPTTILLPLDTSDKTLNARAQADSKSPVKPSLQPRSEAPSRQTSVSTVSSTSAATTPVSAPKRRSSGNVLRGSPVEKKRKALAGGPRRNDPTAAHFSKLSVMHRVQKRGRDEPVPDINALQMIDPKTGILEPPKQVQTKSPIKPGSASTPAVVSSTEVNQASPPEPAQMNQVTTASPTQKNRTTPPASTQNNKTATPTSAQKNGFTASTPFQKNVVTTSITAQKSRVTTSTPDEKKSATTTKATEKNVVITSTAAHGNQVTTPSAAQKHQATKPSPVEKTSLAAPSSPTPIAKKVLPGNTTTETAKAEPSQMAKAHDHMAVGNAKDGDNLPIRQTSQLEQTILPPRGPRKELTCWFWRSGRGCNRHETDCWHSHYDTGYYAPRPPPREYRKDDYLPTNVTRGENQNQYNSWKWRRDSALNESITGGSTPRSEISDSIDRGQELGRSIAPPRPIDESNMPARRTFTQKQDSFSDFTIKATLKIDHLTTSRPETFQARLKVSEHALLTKLAGREPYLIAHNVVLAQDLKTIALAHAKIGTELSCSGEIIIEHPEEAKTELVPILCKIHECGLIATPNGHDTKVIIYPNMETWKFLDVFGAIPTSGSALRFCLLPRLPGLSERNDPPSNNPPFPTIQRPIETTIGNIMAKLDHERLMTKEELKGTVERVVFIMIPCSRTAEFHFLVRFFRGLKFKIYHSGTSGAWSYFRHRYSKSCLIIIHPDIPLSRIAGLHDFLASTGSAARFFTIGVDPHAAILDDREPSFGCTRYFPHGTVYFITDDVLVYHPENATDLIRTFLERHKHKPEGGENDRIVARPGVKTWLFRLAQTRFAESGGQDIRMTVLYEALCRLCPVEDEDPHDPPNPASTSMLISVPPDTFPRIEKLWEKDESAATDYMVNWFAGWSVMNASRFRKFIVCHEAKSGNQKLVMNETGRMVPHLDLDPMGWAEKYQNIGVLLPTMCFKKGNRK